MKPILESIKSINTNCQNVAVMFSCGRDSTVMLDLFHRYAPDSIGSVFFMYYCPGLSYEEKILTYYEKRYRLKIERVAHPDCAYLVNSRVKKTKIRIANLEKVLRSEYGAEWIAWGYRKDESLYRRGQLALTESGIDYKYRKVFPLSEWAQRHTAAYCKERRLILPPEYKFNMRDINTFKGESLMYIYNNYPRDYAKIIEMYPDVEGELMRAKSGIGGHSK